MYELECMYDKRQSFYRKAYVVINNSTKTLYSYETKVCEIKDNDIKIFGFYSQTTLRHIKEFLRQEGFEVSTKKELEKYLV